MALAVARRRERVDGVDQVAGCQQGTDEQAPIGLDADHHVVRPFSVLPEQGVQPGHALEPFRYPARGQHSPLAVEHAHVMVCLGPVDAHEDHHRSSSRSWEPLEAVAAEVVPSPVGSEMGSSTEA
jgi:hypothetical protein